LPNPVDNTPPRLKLPAALEALDPFQDFVRNQTRDCGCSAAAQFKIQLALEEAVVNIVHYAYPPGVEGWIELACQLEEDGRRLAVEIRDGGRAFNPLERGQPDTNASLEQRQIGGLGIFLIRKMAEKADYFRDGDVNVLALEFRLDAAQVNAADKSW